MKILNIRPKMNWEDTNGYHDKLGIHTYEDQSQEIDPVYHLLGEVEREHYEKLRVQEFRRGSEVKFVVGNKRPVFSKARY